MPLESLMLVLAIQVVALISPGPDFAVVSRQAIVAGRRTGLLTAAAIGVYVLICVLGLALVLLALPGIARVLAAVGGLYLAWLGLNCLRSKGKLPEASQSPARGGRAFLIGFMTNLLNPKAMLYFSSILAQALRPELGAADAALLWALLVGESLLWFGLVAVLLSSQRVLKWLSARLIWFDRAIGVVLLAFAAKLASSALK